MSVKQIILGILSWKASTGYEIKNEVEYSGRQLGWGKMSYGSIYPTLKELQQEGLITVQESNTTNRITKVYDITSKGWLELESWIEEPSAYPITKDDLLIKMSFWDHVRSSDDDTILISKLEERKNETQNLLNHFLQWENNEVSTIGRVAFFSMDYVKSKLETELKWIEKTLTSIKIGENLKAKDPNNLIRKSSKRKQGSLEINDWSEL
ncbi:hypothetical protein FZC76_18020 [Sutcliffiella horikoshii]|uniref:Transcription regulator PadR N-terminal domain-containing protein n=1 Tax=Sutcliffiella horikoshii TaxID=79883 RepID=A0A5D4SR13_9BACI|nr:PadR family transcriptional regulator [Sutcliffiella horikoshii]TYS65777.1 hypothetical protein FZC76_18020 [Sutcliffiella horikoshii]